MGLAPSGVGFAVFAYVFFAYIIVGEFVGIAFCALVFHVGFSVNIMVSKGGGGRARVWGGGL